MITQRGQGTARGEIKDFARKEEGKVMAQAYMVSTAAGGTQSVLQVKK